jgi:hypothetical protein
LKKLLGGFKEMMWAEEALAKQVYFPDLKPGDGFARQKDIPEDRKIDGYTITSVKASGDETNVEGELTGPKRKTKFTVVIVKEKDKLRVGELTLADK